MASWNAKLMWLIIRLDWALPIKIQAPIWYLVYHTVPTRKGAPSLTLAILDSSHNLRQGNSHHPKILQPVLAITQVKDRQHIK